MNKQTTNKKLSGNPWLKLILLLVIIFSTAALLVTYIGLAQLKERNEYLQQQALELEQGNQNIQGYIDHKGTDEGVKDVATGELGMVDPDTVIYDFD